MIVNTMNVEIGNVGLASWHWYCSDWQGSMIVDTMTVDIGILRLARSQGPMIVITMNIRMHEYLFVCRGVFGLLRFLVFL